MQHTQEVTVDNFYPYSYFSASREQSRHYQTNQYLQNHPHPLLYPPYAYSSYPAFRFNAAMGSIQQDMDEFQKLSNQYEPELEGPLVGPKQSSAALTTEYADADPIYVTKTTALARSHSHYRIMKGDGNCGWRAIAFGYFETLFLLRDTARVSTELTRIKGFNKLLDAVGQQEHLYEIFVDATEDLFGQILEAIEEGSYDDSFLLEAFNAEYNSSAIITHFRLMTSAWMKLNANRYQAFLSVPLDQYCATTIETVKTEIDEVGLQGLVDGVIQDSGFAVEILYLDRSDGTEVTPHLLTSGNTAVATIRMLYRPGHYDLLYQTVPQQTSVQVNYQIAESLSCVPPQDPFPYQFEFNPLLFSIPNLTREHSTNPTSFSCAPDYGFPVQAETVPQRPLAPQSPISLSPPACQPEFTGTLQPEQNGADNSSDLPIRLSVWNPQWINAMPLSSRNSHVNQAHFQNANFQPSQWSPSDADK